MKAQDFIPWFFLFCGYSPHLMDSAVAMLPSELLNSGWTKRQRYCLMIPNMRNQRCSGTTGVDRCERIILREAWARESIELQLIRSQPWEVEQLRPLFEEIADVSLCIEHKAQIKLVAEIWRHDAWRNGWIMEFRFSDHDIDNPPGAADRLVIRTTNQDGISLDSGRRGKRRKRKSLIKLVTRAANELRMCLPNVWRAFEKQH